MKESSFAMSVGIEDAGRSWMLEGGMDAARCCEESEVFGGFIPIVALG